MTPTQKKTLWPRALFFVWFQTTFLFFSFFLFFFPPKKKKSPRKKKEKCKKQKSKEKWRICVNPLTRNFDQVRTPTLSFFSLLTTNPEEGSPCSSEPYPPTSVTFLSRRWHNFSFFWSIWPLSFKKTSIRTKDSWSIWPLPFCGKRPSLMSQRIRRTSHYCRTEY